MPEGTAKKEDRCLDQESWQRPPVLARHEEHKPGGVFLEPFGLEGTRCWHKRPPSSLHLSRRRSMVVQMGAPLLWSVLYSPWQRASLRKRLTGHR